MTVKRLDLVRCGLNPRSGRPRIIISTDSVDVMHDVIVQSGLEITPPIRMLLNHDYHSLPVGIIPDAASVHRGAHRTEVEFDFFEGDLEIARVANLYKQGGFDASVGFRIVKASPNEHGGLTITQSVLHEVSLTATPANRDCQAVVRSLFGVRGGSSADDEIGDLDAQDVIAAVTMIVPQLAAQEVARLRGRIDGVIDLGEIDGDAFDPFTSDTDRAELVAAVKIAVPEMVRAELNRLRGRID